MPPSCPAADAQLCCDAFFIYYARQVGLLQAEWQAKSDPQFVHHNPPFSEPKYSADLFFWVFLAFRNHFVTA